MKLYSNDYHTGPEWAEHKGPGQRATAWVMRLRFCNSTEWRVFKAQGPANALKRAEGAAGCLEVQAMRQITLAQYAHAMEQQSKNLRGPGHHVRSTKKSA